MVGTSGLNRSDRPWIRGCSETIDAFLPFNHTRICPRLMSREKLALEEGLRKDQDFSVDTPKACQRSRRVSGALPSLTPCPFGHIYPRPVAEYSWKYPVGPGLCGAPKSQFHQFSISYLRIHAVNAVDWQQYWQQIGHLRRTGRDPAQA